MKAAVLEREKRVTAGKRMSTLVGKAAEEDDEFWNQHETNVEEDDGSFHESDEEEANRVDVFDSDFNDSESEDDDSDNDENEQAILQEEKQKQKQKQQRSSSSSSSTKKQQRSSLDPKKFVNNENLNAGLTLNFPGTTTTTVPKNRTAAALAARKTYAAMASTSTTTTTTTTTMTVSIPSRRSTRPKASALPMIVKPAASRKSSQKKKSQHTQEELLLEAAQVTEPENERWILGRKRDAELLKDHCSLQKNKLQKETHRKVISKFHSRRGCYNTITFPEMDLVPPILTTTTTRGKRPRTSPKRCVITGKVARYTCPKTNHPYYDLPSFQELRRRYQQGEPIIPPPLPLKQQQQQEQQQQQHIHKPTDEIVSYGTNTHTNNTVLSTNRMTNSNPIEPSNPSTNNNADVNKLGVPELSNTKVNHKPARKRKTTKKDPNNNKSTKKIKQENNTIQSIPSVASMAPPISLTPIVSLSSPTATNGLIDPMPNNMETSLQQPVTATSISSSTITTTNQVELTNIKQEIMTTPNKDVVKVKNESTIEATIENAKMKLINNDIVLPITDKILDCKKKPEIICENKLSTKEDTIITASNDRNVQSNKTDFASTDNTKDSGNCQTTESSPPEYASMVNPYSNGNVPSSTKDIIATVLSQYAELQRKERK